VAADTEHRRTIKPTFPTLRAEHADDLLRAVSEPWRDLFATARCCPFSHAIGKRSQREYVFARPDGSIRPLHANPEKILRTALKRIGVNDGFRHICRRCSAKGAPHIEEHPDEQERRFPEVPSAKPSRCAFMTCGIMPTSCLCRAVQECRRLVAPADVPGSA